MFTQKLNTLTPSLDFQIFYASFCQRNLSAIASLLLITVNHLQINIFLFQSFLQFFPSTNIFLQYLDTLSHYLYMANIIPLKTFYVILRVIVWVINIGYLLLYLLVRLALYKKRKYKGLEQIFTLFNTYFTMVFLLPSMEILFKEIVCDQSILEPLGQECLQGEHIFIFTMSIIAAASAFIMGFLSVFFSQNGIYDKKNYLSGENRGYEGLVAIVKILLGITVTIQNDSLQFQRTYYIVNLCCSLAVIVYFGVFFPYNKPIIERTSLFWLAIYLVQSIATVVSLFTNQTDLIGGVPFFGFVVVAVYGTNYIYQQRKNSLIFREKVSSTGELQTKVQNILQLKQTEKLNTQQELFFRGVVSTHMKICIDPGCFCKKKELYDPKKGKNLDLEKWPIYKSMTIKYYVRFLFEHQIRKNHMDTDLLIAYAQFLFEKFRNIHLALSQIIKVTNLNTFLYPHQKHKIFKLRQRISEYVTARNQEAFDISLGIEEAISVEEQFNDVIEQMKKIIQASLSFWSYLCNKELDLDKIQVLVEELCRTVDVASNMWMPLKPFLYKHKKLMYYYNWFLKEFMNKKIILSEEGVDDLFDDEKGSVHSQDFLSTIKNDNMLFYDDTPIVHMSGNYNDMGKVIKVNKAASAVFGYDREELEKSNVNILMPRIISVRHNYYLESFVRTGKTRALYNQKKTFASNKQGYIFPLWVVVKQLNNTQGLIQYVALLRPMSEKKDRQSLYMLFDDNGEISGMCHNFSKFFTQYDSNIHKRRFNIILLAPKLIKYLYFCRFIMEEKEKEKENHSKRTVDTDKRRFTEELSLTSPETKTHQDTPKKGSTRPQFNKGFSFALASNRLYELQDFLDLDKLSDGDAESLEIAEEEKKHGVAYEKKIEFTLRLPKKFNHFMKEFEELKVPQKEVLNNILGNHLTDNKQQYIQLNSLDSGRSLGMSPEAPKSAFFKAGSPVGSPLNSPKQTTDSYLTALKVVAQRIAKCNDNRVFRVKGVIGTDYYGPDNDIVKYVKIYEIASVDRRKSTYNSVNNPEKSKELRSANSGVGSLSEVTSKDGSSTKEGSDNQPIRRGKSIKPIKMSRFSNFKGENVVMKKVDMDIESAASEQEERMLDHEDGKRSDVVKYYKPDKKEIDNDSLISKLSKSSKEEEEENESKGSGGESARQDIVNELKNNLISQFQNMYYKEENMLIDKDFKSLKKLKWCTYILFLTIIPINLGFFIASTNTAMDYSVRSVNNIFSNERLRKDFLFVHNAIVTILLDSTSNFNNITIVDQSKVDELLAYEMQVIQRSYQDVLTVSSQDEWTEILYEYAPKVQQIKLITYIGDSELSKQEVSLETAFWKLTNALAEISLYNQSKFTTSDQFLLFYRYNCLDLFNDVFYRTSLNLFDSITDILDQARSLSIWCLIIEAVVLVGSLAIILLLITIVTRSLKEILKAFTAIDNLTIKETESYYQKLAGFFNLAQAQYVNNEIHKGMTKSTNSIALVKQVSQSNRFEKKLKKVKEDNFMRSYARKILAYYIVAIVISVAMLVIFDLQVGTTVDYANSVLSDAKQIVEFNSVYLTSLIGLKSLFISKEGYKIKTIQLLQNTISLLGTTLDKSSIKSDSNFGNLTREIYGGKVCDIFKPSFADAQEFEDCHTLSLGKLSLGLVSFHNYYRDLVLDALQLNEERFGSLSIDNIYEFEQLIRIIDEILLERSLEVWKEDIAKYINSQQNVLLIIIIVLNFVNAVVFYWAQRGVLRGLNNKFLFYRKVYNRYMLAEALMKEKRIKARLLKFNLLNK